MAKTKIEPPLVGGTRSQAFQAWNEAVAPKDIIMKSKSKDRDVVFALRLTKSERDDIARAARCAGERDTVWARGILLARAKKDTDVVVRENLIGDHGMAGDRFYTQRMRRNSKYVWVIDTTNRIHRVRCHEHDVDWVTAALESRHLVEDWKKRICGGPTSV
jgi:hypothetical protein